jgi:CRP/FNR family cyclic AMP-dependent transcriptional regulator
MQASKPKEPSPCDVLSDAELKALSERAIMRAFAKNTVIVSEGDRADSLYIVLSGRVRAYVSDDQGKEMFLSEAGKGEYFGEMALDEGPRSASVITLEPTRLLVVPKDDFAAFLAKSPEFALHLVRKLIRRVRALTHDVKSLALMDVYGRVARMLLDLAVAQEMANRVGASREMISRILTELAAGGYIEVARDRITISRTLPCGW